MGFFSRLWAKVRSYWYSLVSKFRRPKELKAKPVEPVNDIHHLHR